MFSSVLDIMKTAITAVFDWFYQIVDKIGAFPFLITTLIFVLFMARIILPNAVNFLSSGSDSIKNSKRSDN